MRDVALSTGVPLPYSRNACTTTCNQEALLSAIEATRMCPNRKQWLQAGEGQQQGMLFTQAYTLMCWQKEALAC